MLVIQWKDETLSALGVSNTAILSIKTNQKFYSTPINDFQKPSLFKYCRERERDKTQCSPYVISVPRDFYYTLENQVKSDLVRLKTKVIFLFYRNEDYSRLHKKEKKKLTHQK